jgi:cytochrome c-type biogenesis protein CcmE
MKARTKFLVGGAVVLSTSGFLMWSSIKDTSTFVLKPAELHAKVKANPSWAKRHVRVGASVVPGSIVKGAGGREHIFLASFEGDTLPIVYRGIAPDTFSDSADVVVEGSLDSTGTFQATTLLAKCASRYENAPGYPGSKTTGTHPAGIPKKP